MRREALEGGGESVGHRELWRMVGVKLDAGTLVFCNHATQSGE
jgi:hypothetical protein